MFMLVMRVAGNLETNGQCIARRRFCIEFVEFYDVAASKADLGGQTSQHHSIGFVCFVQFQILRFVYVGGAFGRPFRSQHSMNRTCSFLRFVFLVEFVDVAILKVDVGRQLDNCF